MVAFAIRSASATLPNIRPSAVHILNHLPGYAVTDRLPLIVAPSCGLIVRIAQSVRDNTIHEIKIFYQFAWH